MLEPRLEAVKAAYDQGNYSQAAAQLQALLQQQPQIKQSPVVQLYVGLLYARQGQRPKAEAILRRLLQSTHNRQVLHQARQALNELLRGDPAPGSHSAPSQLPASLPQDWTPAEQVLLVWAPPLELDRDQQQRCAVTLAKYLPGTDAYTLQLQMRRGGVRILQQREAAQLWPLYRGLNREGLPVCLVRAAQIRQLTILPLQKLRAEGEGWGSALPLNAVGATQPPHHFAWSAVRRLLVTPVRITTLQVQQVETQKPQRLGKPKIQVEEKMVEVVQDFGRVCDLHLSGSEAPILRLSDRDLGQDLNAPGAWEQLLSWLHSQCPQAIVDRSGEVFLEELVRPEWRNLPTPPWPGYYPAEQPYRSGGPTLQFYSSVVYLAYQTTA